MKKQLVKYRAVKVVNKPVKIEFSTKEGEKLLFKGIKGVEVFDPTQLKTPDLIRWLKKNGFNVLAQELKVILKTALREIDKE